jgi:hypothetical protein
MHLHLQKWLHQGIQTSQHQELSALLMWDVMVEPPQGVPQLGVELYLLNWKICSSFSFAC